MQTPHVLVGCPTSDHKAYCLQAYVKALKTLTYSNHDTLLVDNSKTYDYYNKIKQLNIPVLKDVHLERARQRIVHSRNILRKKILEGDYEYFLSLEQDVIPQKDIIEHLLKHKKQVVTGVYFTKYKLHGQPIFRPLLWKSVPGQKTLQFISETTLQKPQLLAVKASGLGCILIHRDILQQIPFRLPEDSAAYDDMAFCEDLHKQNIPLYADTAMKCKHLITGMNWESIKE